MAAVYLRRFCKLLARTLPIAHDDVEQHARNDDKNDANNAEDKERYRVGDLRWRGGGRKNVSWQRTEARLEMRRRSGLRVRGGCNGKPDRGADS